MKIGTLQHTAKLGRPGKWAITINGACLLETGSSFQVLRFLKKHSLPVPEVMAGPDCWDREYTIEFHATCKHT